MRSVLVLDEKHIGPCGRAIYSVYGSGLIVFEKWTGDAVQWRINSL